ncbi:DUF3304 domain-containing protein [Burkholderia sp. 22PA0106]|uniref:DUF3304 domain-containing protein n=1 Tax=Burkholderia sp. 22PA0106 TaxID=3237371 RepID=UPI0039C0614F
MIVALGACGKSEPTYSAISLMNMNYTPYNMDGFTVTDAYGNKASGGGGDPPGWGGGMTCCYKLKGTEFIVKWNYYDADQWHKGDKRTFHAETKVSMPATPLPDPVGARLLEVHFYPDQHVELQFPGGYLDRPRVPMIEVVQWMQRYQSLLDKRYDEREDQQMRRITRVVAAAWLKYRLADSDDLKQYVYFSLLVNNRFDAQADVQRMLQASKGTPGAFAKAIRSLAPNVMAELKHDKFVPVAVPEIADGLLPQPRTETVSGSTPERARIKSSAIGQNIYRKDDSNA